MPRSQVVPRAHRAVPSAAKTWSLRSHVPEKRKNRETGKPYTANVTKQMKGEPDENGDVAESWPVAEFSTKEVLDRWGPGRYSVDFFDKRGEKIDGWAFTVAEPTETNERRRRPRDEGDAGEDEDDPAAMAMRLPKTQLEWFIYQQQREERSERRRRDEAREERDRMRQEAEDRATRDRDFLTALSANVGRAPASDAASMELLRRETQLSIRENMMDMERRLGARIQSFAPAATDDDDDDEREPPKNAGEAVERLGLSMLTELEKKSPEVLEAMLPKVVQWMEHLGVKPSANMVEQIDEVRQRRSRVAPNGQSRAG